MGGLCSRGAFTDNGRIRGPLSFPERTALLDEGVVELTIPSILSCLNSR